MFKQIYINITLTDALILILKYQKILKALLCNKEKLLELANTPLNENCLAIILKKLSEKLRDPGKFLIPCGFSELKCKALADLGASINLMPFSVWKMLGLPELISTRMTPELANRVICTSTGIAKDVFILVGKLTFLADFVIIDYESDPRVPLILGRSFLWTARALIDVHREEIILFDGDERLTLNMRHETSSYSDQPQKESINMINIYDELCEDYLEDLFVTNHLRDIVQIEKLTNIDSTKDLSPPHNINPLSGSITSSSPDHLLEEFADELALITFPPKWILFLRIRLMKMFTDEHTLDYLSPLIYDYFYDDLNDLDEFESDNDDAYTDPFESKGDKIKESKLLIDELDLPRSSKFLPSPEYDSFLFEDFSEVDALPSTNNEDKVFNLGILIHENLFEVNTCVAPDKNIKKISISHASLILKDFDPPLFDYELPFHKEVSGSETLLLFSSENEEKVFKPGILTSKGVYIPLLPELSHRGSKAFKVIKIFESPMEIFPCSFG
nr:reverse transcriptase domain-containing protein [Tanacetum cinerariifolium]